MIENEEELKRRLDGLKAKRGYLLPHHGLMAIAAPNLLEAYDAAYTALALDRRTLGLHDREFVWLAILIATDEALATHHIAKFKAADGSDGEISAILALAAFACGFRAYRFVNRSWAAHVPALDVRASYFSASEACAAGAAPRLARLALAALHACNGDWDALGWEIAACYAHGVPELELAEALSLVMFPGSVPNFVEACAVWRGLIASGDVQASPPFRIWAAMSGQGGYDEISGTERQA